MHAVRAQVRVLAPRAPWAPARPASTARP